MILVSKARGTIKKVTAIKGTVTLNENRTKLYSGAD
jgi:hypothetical protein